MKIPLMNPSWKSCRSIGYLSALGACVPSTSEAAIVYDILEVNGDIVLSSNGGTMDITGYSVRTTASWSFDRLYWGAGSTAYIGGGTVQPSNAVSTYTITMTEDSSAGWTASSASNTSDSATGDMVAIIGGGKLRMTNDNEDLVNNTVTVGPISMTLTNTTYASLGLTGGEWYRFTLENGDTMILSTGAMPVPEPSSLAMGLLGALVLCGRRKRQ